MYNIVYVHTVSYLEQIGQNNESETTHMPMMANPIGPAILSWTWFGAMTALKI